MSVYRYLVRLLSFLEITDCKSFAIFHWQFPEIQTKIFGPKEYTPKQEVYLLLLNFLTLSSHSFEQINEAS